MTLKHLLTAVAIVALAGAAPRAQSPDPMFGTWKLNIAKSKAPYKSGTSVIEAAGDARQGDGRSGERRRYRLSLDVDGEVRRQGRAGHGHDAVGPGTVASLTRVDAHTAKVVGKQKGEEILTQTIVTSADGKTRTVTTKRKDAKGQPVETVTVYDKQ